MNKRQEPRLRFQGFTGAWEKSALKDVVNVFDNLRIPVAGIERVSGNTPYFGANGIQDYVDGFTHDGEFVLIAEDGANDLQNYPVQYFNGKGWVNNHAHVLQGKADILNNLFLFYRFQSMDISRFLVGGGRAKLNSGTMIGIEIEFPKNKKEQTHLGNFFHRLDSQIAESRAVLKKSRQLKKAMLAKMFPANGEKIPKIRFKGFEGEWESRKLGEIGELYQPRTITGTDLTFTGYPVFGANGYIGFYDEANHFEDQVTISARGEGTGTANYVTAPVWITGNSMVINVDCNNEIDKNFLFALLTAMSLKKYVTGGAQPQLTREVLEKISLKIPTLPEQTAIGLFFRQLDKTIALQSAEVEKLNQLKKGLLAAMLV